MCRTGRIGAGSSYRIPFEGNGGAKGAEAKAKDWLKDMSDAHTLQNVLDKVILRL